MTSARKKLLLLPRGAQPFSRSGSFEPSNNDGWAMKDGMVKGGVNDSNQGPRTGTWYMGARGQDGLTRTRAVEYTLTRQEVEGLRLTFSIYESAIEGGTWRVLRSFDGGATFAQIATGQMGTAGGKIYRQLSTTFDVGRTGVVIRLEGTTHYFSCFDDWSLVGAHR